MTSKESSGSKLLRGAIKANSTGIYFFDWSDIDPKPINTKSALDNSKNEIDKKIGTTTHNYDPILPLLYPFRDIYGNMSDYAYILPIQFEQLRFGGVCITNPFDTSGTKTWVEFAESSDTVNMVLNRAINEYLLLLGEDTATESNYTETFVIEQITSFESNGNTNYVAEGNLTYMPLDEETPKSENTTVWFTQNYLNITQWEIVLFLHVGDVLQLEVSLINDIFYCMQIFSVN
ncbi:MAG: hypothetical protein U9O98_11590 [Asgard group archaeon]|nr:hypothetical protein [Asgard group archaeon]